MKDCHDICNMPEHVPTNFMFYFDGSILTNVPRFEHRL